jgi:hypothetical protein
MPELVSPRPSMPDHELLNDVPVALERSGSRARNAELREALGWGEAEDEAVKAELVARRIVVRGRGRSDSVALAEAEPADPLTDAAYGKNLSGKGGRLWKALTQAHLGSGRCSLCLGKGPRNRLETTFAAEFEANAIDVRHVEAMVLHLCEHSQLNEIGSETDNALMAQLIG